MAKSSYGDYDFTPATVDEFKIWYGDRVMLQNIGYILRGAFVGWLCGVALWGDFVGVMS